jgi:hypothetical protein
MSSKSSPDPPEPVNKNMIKAEQRNEEVRVSRLSPPGNSNGSDSSDSEFADSDTNKSEI